MKKICLLKYSYLLLLCLLTYSCEDTESTDNKVNEKQPPAIVEVMSYLKDKNLSLPDMHHTMNANTRSAIMKVESKSNQLTPDWSSLQTYSDEHEDVRMFLLKGDTNPLSGFTYTRIKGKEERFLAVSVSKLALWKIKDRLVGRIITYLPDRKFLKEGNSVAKLGYKLQGSNYSGFCLVSTLDGKLL